MVLVPLLLLGAGAVAFFSAGGVKLLKPAFGESADPPTTTEKEMGTLVGDTLQSGEGTVPISAGSRRTVGDLEQDDILRVDISTKRKFAPFAEQPPIKVFFDNPREGGVLASQKGTIVGANLSLDKTTKFGTGKFGLTQVEISQVRSQEFTDQERQDIANLTTRFQRKSVSAQKVSDSPEEIIFKKREQEAIAKKVLEANVGVGSFTLAGGVTAERFGLVKRTQEKLFAKPNFIFGGVSEKVFLQQRKEKAEEFARIQEVQRLQQERTEKGAVILRGISASGQTQREFLLGRGIALRGSNLNARALARLQERGLI